MSQTVKLFYTIQLVRKVENYLPKLNYFQHKNMINAIDNTTFPATFLSPVCFMLQVLEEATYEIKYWFKKKFTNWGISSQKILFFHLLSKWPFLLISPLMIMGDLKTKTASAKFRMFLNKKFYFPLPVCLRFYLSLQGRAMCTYCFTFDLHRW